MAVRPIDANTLIDKWRQVQRNFKRGGENHWAELADMVIDDVSRAPTLLLVDINTVPTLAQPNDPLTLEELREMDGEPVWFDTIKRWGIVRVCGYGISVLTKSGEYDVTRMKFYRRPPEGEGGDVGRG